MLTHPDTKTAPKPDIYRVLEEHQLKMSHVLADVYFLSLIKLKNSTVCADLTYTQSAKKSYMTAYYESNCNEWSFASFLVEKVLWELQS